MAAPLRLARPASGASSVGPLTPLKSTEPAPIMHTGTSPVGPGGVSLLGEDVRPQALRLATARRLASDVRGESSLAPVFALAARERMYCGYFASGRVTILLSTLRAVQVSQTSFGRLIRIPLLLRVCQGELPDRVLVYARARPMGVTPYGQGSASPLPNEGSAGLASFRKNATSLTPPRAPTCNIRLDGNQVRQEPPNTQKSLSSSPLTVVTGRVRLPPGAVHTSR